MREIVKYQNRKLYDKDNACYVNISQLVKAPVGSFRVIDHETKEDITIPVLFSALNMPQEDSDKVRVMQYLIKNLQGETNA